MQSNSTTAALPVVPALPALGSLTERAMPAILAQLAKDGNVLTGVQADALRDIPLTIERMAHGVAGDKHLAISTY